MIQSVTSAVQPLYGFERFDRFARSGASGPQAPDRENVAGKSGRDRDPTSALNKTEGADKVNNPDQANNPDKANTPDKTNKANETDKNREKDNPEALTPDEEREVQTLKQRDREVRQHEQAHMAAGGGLVRGGPSYSYQTGPDKKRYAIGGEVSIDASPGRTPEETIPKARRIRAAALAPADPSPQDRSVAAKASQMEGDARMEIAKQRREELSQVREEDAQKRTEQNERKTRPETSGGIGGVGGSNEIRFYQNAAQPKRIGQQFNAYA